MPRKVQAISAKRRVERIQAASRRRVIRAPIAKAKGIVQRDVARVEHRRVDHHARVLEQRVEADAVGRHRVETVANGLTPLAKSISPMKKVATPIITAVA